MSPRPNSVLRLKILGSTIALIQLFDIAIHAATDQLEPLRVTSNVVVLVWLTAMALGRFKAKQRLLAVGSVGVYLGLNILFLALEGVTNENQGGELRIMLFLLIFLTVGLSALLIPLGKEKIRR